MTVREMLEQLSKLHPDCQLMILDGSNGGGDPRTINLGPIAQPITKANIEHTADCEEIPEGEAVYVIGFGCY